MLYEILQAFDRNALTREKIIDEMLTDLGGSFYAYAIMLGIANRPREAKIYHDLRTQIFAVREAKDWDQSHSTAMLRIATRIHTLYEMLQAVKSDEASIVQSAVNDALHIKHAIDELVAAKQVPKVAP